MSENNNNLNNVANIMGIAVGGIQLFAMLRAMKQSKEEELEERVTSEDVVKIARKVAKAECAKTADMLLREIKKLDVNGLNKSIKELTSKIEGKNN